MATTYHLLRDGFGFGSMLSGAAPNSAVVAQHDRQLEQIVQEVVFSAPNTLFTTENTRSFIADDG